MAKAVIQKNRRRLALELRPQPDPELWRRWVYEIRRILTDWELTYGELPAKASRITRIDELRRWFDSHGSNLLEAILAAEDDDDYWERLVNHPGGSYAETIPFESISKTFKELQASPGYNRNTLKFYYRRG